MLNSPDIIKQILQMKHIAVVGLSPNEQRPSNDVARYLLAQNYTLYPVNPGFDRLLDLPAYPSLESIPDPVEVVDIFRRPEHVVPIVEEAIAIGAKAVWLQLGVISDEGARKAAEAGLLVVMDRCIKIEHDRFVNRR